MDRARAEARLDAVRQTPRIDYARMQREWPKQKRRLTLAVKSGDYERVLKVCALTVAEWDEIGAWPDDWALFERALDDAYGAARHRYVRGETEEEPLAINSLRELRLIEDLL